MSSLMHLALRLMPFSFFILLSLSGCQTPPGLSPISLTPNVNPQPPHSPNAVTSAFLAPAGDYSAVIVRTRPDIAKSSDDRTIICTAPSPDWATALAAARQLQASGGASGGPSASLSASSSLTETVTAMLGRTAGVVALRDGLYKACEAYANGVIGKDAYALVLSQYGNLLVALAGGGAGAGGSGGPASTGTPAGGVQAGVAVNVSSGAAPKGSGSASPPAASPGGTVIASMQQQALQAMLVTCINEFDPTVRPEAEQNAALAEPCKTLIGDVVNAAPSLLGSPDAAPKAARKPTSNAGLRQIQQALKDNCQAEVKADGLWGQQTDAALAKFAGNPCLLKARP